MYLRTLERSLKKDHDFKHCEKSFTSDIKDLTNKNTIITIQNILMSPNECMIKWVLYTVSKRYTLDFEPYLLNLLKNDDEYIKYKTVKILTRLYADTIPSEQYFVFIKKNLRNDSYDAIDQTLSFMAELLYNKRYSLKIVKNQIYNRNILKMQFCEDETFMSHVSRYIKVQELKYNILKIVLVLTYDTNCIPILHGYKVIDEVVEILLEKSREKLMRICVGIIKNCLERGYNFNILTAHKIVEVVDGTYNDIDMNIEMGYIKNVLTVFIKNTSGIDNYFDELFSGKLEENPYHFNDTFWEGNIEKLLENKIEVVKALKKYLRCGNLTAVYVAANDIYRFVKVAPEVRIYIEKYGIKDDLFQLVNSKDPDIRFHSIQALSGCIFSEWQ